MSGPKPPGPGGSHTRVGGWPPESPDIAEIRQLLEDRDRDNAASSADKIAYEAWKKQIQNKLKQLDDRYDFFRSVADYEFQTRRPKSGWFRRKLWEVSSEPHTETVQLDESLKPPIESEDSEIYARLLEGR
jgi:hypothetical protein